MDRSQHTRFLTYLQKYEYFGRGRERLDAETFAAFDTEVTVLALSANPEQFERQQELLAALLRD